MASDKTSSRQNVLGHSRIFTTDVINDIHVKADLGRYRMPRLDLAVRYNPARELFKTNSDKYCLGVLAGFPFSIMRYLTGFASW
jgi:hypothetical protein